MKKYFVLLGAVLAMASCTTVTKTAKTADVNPSSLYSATVSDLDVANNRISYKMTNIPKAIQRGGFANVQRAAINECLEKEGKGQYDLLVEPEYVYEVKRGFFSKKIVSIEVSGRPAKYKNFHSLNDSVWCNPIFRNRQTNNVKTPSGFLKGFLGK